MAFVRVIIVMSRYHLCGSQLPGGICQGGICPETFIRVLQVENIHALHYGFSAYFSAGSLFRPKSLGPRELTDTIKNDFFSKLYETWHINAFGKFITLFLCWRPYGVHVFLINQPK